MNTLAQTSLYYAEGRSNKEYHAELVGIDGGYLVNFRFGRRGASLTAGTKTATPVDFAQAKTIYDKLVKEKTAKGYTPDVSGAAYQSTENTGRHTSFVPQLLNPISESEALRLLTDPHWAAQEKMDGERLAAHADKLKVAGVNRKGLIVPLPKTIADELQHITATQGTIRVDGELISDILYVFDLHIHQGDRIHALPWIDRMHLAEKALAGCMQIKAIPVAVSTEDKRALWTRVKLAHGEGLVFKQMNAPVTEGRPNTGGDWLKYKFTETASCCVLQGNLGKRSVRIGVLDGSNSSEGIMDQKLIPVGNVTIPPNQSIPTAGHLIEVAYLYAYPGGSLYQPVYRGQRLDLDIKACTLNQLKYKPEGRDDDES